MAVQGQTGAQPEGSFLNFINWIGNVIAPVGAGGAVLGAVVSWLTGRGFGRWLFAAAALRAIQRAVHAGEKPVDGHIKVTIEAADLEAALETMSR